MRGLLFILIVSILGADFPESEEILITDRKIKFLGSEIIQDAFFMDRYEITQAQYHALAKTSALKPSWFLPRDLDKDGTLPVTGVDWFDALNYCNQQGKRLPTYKEFLVASFGEWERRFAFGDELPKVAPFRIGVLAPKGPLEVQSFSELQSSDGFYNLAGNVAEWLMDSEQDGTLRRVSGGSYVSEVHQVQVGAFFLLNPSENSLPTVGFRCARPARRPTVVSEAEKTQLFEEKQATAGRMMEEQMRLDQERKEKFLKAVLREELELRRSLANSLTVTDGHLSMPEGALMHQGELKLTQSFAIDIEPVKLKDYRVFVDGGHTQAIPLVRVSGRINDSETSPVKVLYQDALAYCTSRGMRLPTALEWVRAWHHNKPTSEALKHSQQESSATGMRRLTATGMEWLGHPPMSQIPETISTAISFNSLVFATIGPLAEEMEKDSHKIRGALAYSRQSFRCVLDLPPKLGFEVSVKNNYFSQEFFKEMQQLIEDGHNIFEIDHQSLEFEKKMLGLDVSSQKRQGPLTVPPDSMRE